MAIAKVPQLRGDGVFDPDNSDERIAPPLIPVAYARTSDSGDWQLKVRFENRDGIWQTRLVKEVHLRSRGREVLKFLADDGYPLPPAPETQKVLIEALCHPGELPRLLLVGTTGWQGEQLGTQFILGDQVYGGENAEIQPDETLTKLGPNLAQSGSLKGWKRYVAKPAKWNPLLIFALSAAFAPPLIGPLRREPFGLQFFGEGSTGKTTVIDVAGSVWGWGSRGYHKTWNTTVNALEPTAQAHNDALLALDEVQTGTGERQKPGESVIPSIFRLLSGEPKKRLGADGSSLSKSPSWKLIYMSTSEFDLRKLANDSGQELTKGHQVRCIDIPADTFQFGCFEHVPDGFDSSAQFARGLRERCTNHHGTPIDAYLQAITADEFNWDNWIPWLNARRERFQKELEPVPGLPENLADRIVQHFSDIYAAGALASKLEILPFRSRRIRQACAQVYYSAANHYVADRSKQQQWAARVLKRFVAEHRRLLTKGYPPSKTEIDCATKCGYLSRKENELAIRDDQLKSKIDGQPGQVLQHLADAGVLIPGTSKRTKTRKMADGEKIRMLVFNYKRLNALAKKE